MADDEQVRFMIGPSPDHPGWTRFDLDAPDRYNAVVFGPLITRRDSDGRCRVRCFPKPHLRNVFGALHGGALLGLIDISLFAGLAVLTGDDPGSAVTLDVAAQFIAPGRLDHPLDAVVELLRETGRLAFLRGLLEQDGAIVASFSGTVRKTSPRP